MGLIQFFLFILLTSKPETWSKGICCMFLQLNGQGFWNAPINECNKSLLNCLVLNHTLRKHFLSLFWQEEAILHFRMHWSASSSMDVLFSSSTSDRKLFFMSPIALNGFDFFFFRSPPSIFFSHRWLNFAKLPMISKLSTASCVEYIGVWLIGSHVW